MPANGQARVQTQAGSASIPIGFHGTTFSIAPGVNTMRIVEAARAPSATRVGQRHPLDGRRPSGNVRATTGRIRAYPNGTSAGPSSTSTFATGSRGSRSANVPANA